MQAARAQGDAYAARLAHRADESLPALDSAAIQAARALDPASDGLEVVEALVRVAESQRFPDPSIERALGELARRGGETAFRAAQALLHPPLLSGMNAIRAGRSRDARLVPSLLRVLDSDARKDMQNGALQALAYVQGRDAVPRLLDALADPGLQYGAAGGLGIAAGDTQDEFVVAALTLACTGAQVPGWYATAMARVGGPLAMRTLKGLVKRVDLVSAMFMAWRAQGLTIARAVRRLADAGLTPSGRTESDMIATAAREWDGEPLDIWLFWTVLRASGRLVDIYPDDRDDATVARHTIPLQRFAAASGGRIVIEHPSQIDGPANARGEYESIVQFVWGDRVYRVTAIGRGRSFDLLALRTLLNEALRNRGYPERFVRLEGHDSEHLIFGDPRTVESACDDLSIPRGSDRSCLEPWRRRIEGLLWAAGRQSVSRPSGGLAFHIISPTQPGRPFPHGAIAELIAERIPTPVAMDVEIRPGWTTLLVRLNRQQFTAHGPAVVEALFESLCETVDAHLGRTDTADGWASIEEGELAGGIEAVDWIQYFGPKFGGALRSKGSSLADRRQTPRGATIFTARLDPLAPSWVTRQDVARDLYFELRPLPESAHDEVDPDLRLERTAPPAPRAWTPEERNAMLHARRHTLHTVETGMADARLFEQFRRRYLPDGLDSGRLDVLATWLPHYGIEPTAAAFRAIARLHDERPADPLLDPAALEGCVKLVSWGGDDVPLATRELLTAHLVDLADPSAATFARQAYEEAVIQGMIKLTSALIEQCTCERCAELRRARES